MESETDASTTDALHRIELGREWLRRAHGNLLAVHHNTGHAMDHFAAAEAALRDAGHEDLADRVRDEFLPRGFVDDRWSYDIVESFEAGLLADAEALEATAREQLAGGERHVAERQQEREWRDRAGE